MEFIKIFFVQLFFIDGLLFYVHSWNVDHNRLQVLRTGPSINEEHRFKTYHRISNHMTRSANYYKQPHRSADRNYRSNGYFNDQRNKYRNNGQYYRPLEDPSLIYKNRQGPGFIGDNQNDGFLQVQDGRMIMRQQGSVTLPRRGAMVISRPNSTIIYRNNKTRSGRNFENDLSTSESNILENETPYRAQNLCVKCPAERTVIAKKGRNKIILQIPELLNCWGGPLPKSVYFKRIYGPKFGSLLTAGSHITVAHILYKNQSLQLCQYRVNVIVQSCQPLQVPSDVLMHCPVGNVWGGRCYFRCLKHNSKLEGAQRIFCGNDLTWSAQTPKCESAEWCDPPTAPNNGRLDCNTPYSDDKDALSNNVAENTFPEGSVCKAQCSSDFIARPKIAKCIRGSWTSIPFCRRKLQQRRLRRPRRHRYPKTSRANLRENVNKQNYRRLNTN